MKKQKVVVEEDDYASGLMTVITRQFFPELPVLRDASEFMAAEREDNVQKMMEIRARQRRVLELQQQPVEPALQSVDAFVDTYMGEDNASFAQLQEEELRKRQELDVWGRKQRELRAREERKLLRLQGKPEEMAMLEWKPDINRQVMGIPDASNVSEKQLALAAEEAKVRVVEPNNTRFTADEMARLNAPPQSKRTPDDEDKVQKLSQLVHKNRFLQTGEERDGVRTINLDDFYDVSKDVLAEPTVNGYGLIATPTLTTPKLVVNIEMGRHFQMPETPERDKLAFRLADEQSRRRAAVGTPVFRTPAHHRPANSPSLFSPAGQKLLEERLKGATPATYFKSPAMTSSAQGVQAAAKRSKSDPLFTTPTAKADPLFATPTNNQPPAKK